MSPSTLVAAALCALALAIPVLWHKIERVQYALLRVSTFLDPGGAPAAVNYQLKQSLLAVGSGGAFGVGFGEGRQQAGFLPYPYSDFIASNIGEEWGFVGLAAIIIAFAVYAVLGFRIARKARSPFLQLVAVGLTFVTVLTAYLHVGLDKNWILQYSVTRSADAAVSGTLARLEAPWPTC